MSLSIRQLEDALFAEWCLVRPGLVLDGAADELAHGSSTAKLLFVLKEVNDPEGGGWDLRPFVRDGGRADTWDNVSRWVEGIRSLEIDRPWNELLAIDAQRRRNALQSIAAMNLKKSPGGHTTNRVDLARIATQDRAFLNRQFAFYDADIVICCGTDVTNNFDRLIDLPDALPWRLTRRGVEFREYRPRKFIVAFAHPEARVSSNLLYYGLVDAVREIVLESGTVP